MKNNDAEMITLIGYVFNDAFAVPGFMVKVIYFEKQKLGIRHNIYGARPLSMFL